MAKILFITSNRLGDAVLSTGVLDSLLNRYSDSQVTVACGPMAVSIFTGISPLTSVIPLKKQPYHQHWRSLWQKVGWQSWDIVVDLRNTLISRLLWTKKRYIFNSNAHPTLHKVVQHALTLGLSDESIPSPRLWVTQAQEEQVDNLLAQCHHSEEPILAVAPVANWVGKQWPSERFIALIEHLTHAKAILPYARVAVLAAPQEESEAYKVLNAVPKERQINLIAKTDPGTLGAFLKRCTLFVGNDSGLMHCAAAAGIPTVGLFGPSREAIYHPWGQRTLTLRTQKNYEELIDRLRQDSHCANHLMDSLSVASVHRQIENFWYDGNSESLI